MFYIICDYYFYSNEKTEISLHLSFLIAFFFGNVGGKKKISEPE